MREVRTSKAPLPPFAEVRRLCCMEFRSVCGSGVHQDGEVEEDGEGQVEVEREEGEVKERRSWMACGWDEDSRTS